MDNITPTFSAKARPPSTEGSVGVSALAELDRVLQNTPVAKMDTATAVAGPPPTPPVTYASSKAFQQTREDLKSHRAKVESRLNDIQFGDVLRSGRLVQEVVIHSKALTVEFQDLLYSERQQMNRVLDSKKDLGPREAQVFMVTYPLSMGLKTINGTPLPPIELDFAKSLNERVEFVTNRLSGAWLELAWHNYNWFLERCQEVTIEEMGNG